MSPRHPFHIVIDQRARFTEEISVLCGHFSFLERRGAVGRAKTYLKSPFFVTDGRLAVLFQALYEGYQRQAQYLQGGPLLRKLPNGGRGLPSARQLKKLILSLQNELLRFRAVHHLMTHPVEMCRLKVESLRDSHDPLAYNRAVERWQAVTNGLPLGTTRALHAWAAEDAGHFSTAVDKDRRLPDTVDQSERALGELNLLLTGLYQIERAGRKQIFREPDVARRVPEPGPFAGLIELYGDLERLYREGVFDGCLYRRVKEGYLRLWRNLSHHHALGLYISISNFLALAYQEGAPDMKGEMAFWGRLLVETELHRQLTTVTETFFMNRLQEAFIARDRDLADRIMELLAPRLPAGVSEHTIALAEVAMAFYRDDHAEVLYRINRDFGRLNSTRYYEGLRIKSFRLRSALCLEVSGQGAAEEYSKAYGDFTTFIYRHEGELASSSVAYLKRFLQVCARIHSSHWKLQLAEDYRSIVELTTADEPLHGRQWLTCLMRHFNPEINLEGRYIKPTLHQNAGWLNPVPRLP